MKLKFRRLDSSNIHSIAYSSKLKVLVIKFTSGMIYSYYDVGMSMYRRLLNADSHGGFFNAYMKGVYRCEYHDNTATIGEKELIAMLEASIALYLKRKKVK